MERKDGGPAFPTTFKSITGYHLEHKECAFTSGSAVAEYEDVVMPGMTLRDYFAGQALVGLISKSNVVVNYDKGHGIEAIGEEKITEWYNGIAVGAYRYADAMLKEREK